MLIEMSWAKLILMASLLLSAGVFAQDTGQYRSRIMLDPLGELGKGSEMSVRELEQQIDTIADPYARSSATRHLARHYVQQQDYASAIAWYKEALAAQGLSDVANREMLRELAQVYLLSENYRDAATTLERVLRIKLVPESGDFLLLAQSRYKLGNYVAVVAALDGIQAQGLQLDTGQMKQALALYYRTGAFEQCEDILQQLLELQPDDAANWHQLASVFLQQNKRREARDQLMLALEKGIPFTADQLILLIDLQAVTGNPNGAALILQESLKGGLLTANAANYRKLFELWLQARERDRAVSALDTAATLSGDTELYLYLAQLQMEDQHWLQMQDTLLATCQAQLQDRYVSRANLLMGVSLLKQGRDDVARRLFINATLVGGANEQAGQWLGFMDAVPATKDEARRVVGPCYGSAGKKAKLQSLASRDAPSPALGSVTQAVEQGEVAEQQAALQIKTLPAMRFYYSSHPESLAELAPRIRPLATRLNVTLVKNGGSVNGPLHILPGEGDELLVAFPVRGLPQARGRYGIRNSGELKCVWIRIKAAREEIQPRVLEFAQQVSEEGYTPTGERRMVLHGSSDDVLDIEVQVGVQ